MKQHILIVLACMAAASPTQATSLVALGQEAGISIDTQFVSITISPPGFTPAVTIGSGSQMFSAIATGPGGALYGVVNPTSFAAPASLYRIQPDGTVSFAGALPLAVGDHFDTMTFDSSDGRFYAVVEGLSLGPTLFSIQLNGAGSVGFFTQIEEFGDSSAGVAYDSSDGMFYGIDSLGAINRFDLAGHSKFMGVAPNPLDGFSGLTYDAANNVFWTFETPFALGDSNLFQVSPGALPGCGCLAGAAFSGPVVTFTNPLPGSAFGEFVFGQIAVAADATPPSTSDAPEPVVPALVGAGLIAIALVRKRNKTVLDS